VHACVCVCYMYVYIIVYLCVYFIPFSYVKIFLVAAHIIPMENFIWKPLLQNSAKCKLHRVLYEIRGSKFNNTCMCIDNFII